MVVFGGLHSWQLWIALSCKEWLSSIFAASVLFLLTSFIAEHHAQTKCLESFEGHVACLELNP